jgi:antitoxin component HigA of HigAB toxin-antitoxin module
LIATKFINVPPDAPTARPLYVRRSRCRRIPRAGNTYPAHLVVDELKVASEKNVQVRTELANKDDLDELAGLKGDEFDKKYVELMVEDHKKDIEKYQKQAEESKDPAVQKYAQDNIAVLQKHLQMSEQTQAALEKETAVGGGDAGGESK